MNKNIKTVDQYFALLPKPAKITLLLLRRTVKKAAPEAEEVISYGMPALKLNGMLLYYAAFQKHYSLFPFSKTIEVFKRRLAAYELSKGTIKFKFNQPVPVKLVTEMVRFRVKENSSKAALKGLKNTAKKN